MSEITFNLEEFDDGFVPSAGPQGPEVLPDGEYVFEVTNATSKTKNSDKGTMVILELTLEVTSDGMHNGTVVRYPWFIKDKEGACRVGADLKKLGFDSELWLKANDRPFSKELPKAMAHIKGMRFNGRKSTNKGSGDKSFHNINIIKREPDGKPERYGPIELNAPTADIPF